MSLSAGQDIKAGTRGAKRGGWPTQDWFCPLGILCAASQSYTYTRTKGGAGGDTHLIIQNGFTL